MSEPGPGRGGLTVDGWGRREGGKGGENGIRPFLCLLWMQTRVVTRGSRR